MLEKLGKDLFKLNLKLVEQAGEIVELNELLKQKDAEIEKLKEELNNSKNFHCPHYLTNKSGTVSCQSNEIKSLNDYIEKMKIARLLTCDLLQKEIERFIEENKTLRDCVEYYAQFGQYGVTTARETLSKIGEK